MIALEVGGIYKNGRGDYFVVVNASFDLWLDQYGEAYKANGQIHSHTHDSQANLIAEADVYEVCKAHNALTERLAARTAQATECETNETEGLRAELDAAKRALAENHHALQPEEKDTHLLAAYTPERYYGDYPEYINLTMIRRQGDVVLTVRLPTSFGKPPGQSASVRFTRSMWREFIKSVEQANKVFEATDYLDSVM